LFYLLLVSLPYWDRITVIDYYYFHYNTGLGEAARLNEYNMNSDDKEITISK